jgi:hypothetical protein
MKAEEAETCLREEISWDGIRFELSSLSRLAMLVRADMSFILTKSLRQKRKACPTYSCPGFEQPGMDKRYAAQPTAESRSRLTKVSRSLPTMGPLPPKKLAKEIARARQG